MKGPVKFQGRNTLRRHDHSGIPKRQQSSSPASDAKSNDLRVHKAWKTHLQSDTNWQPDADTDKNGLQSVRTSIDLGILVPDEPRIGSDIGKEHDHITACRLEG